VCIGAAAHDRHGLWRCPRTAASHNAPQSVGRTDRRGGGRAAAGPGSVDAAAVVRGDQQRRDGSGGTRGMSFVTTRNAVPLRLADVPVLDIDPFRRAVLSAVATGGRLLLLVGVPENGNGVRLLAGIADDGRGEIGLCSALVASSYPALTPDCPAAH